MIRSGARINDGNLPFKETPLMRAASSHSPELVQLLLEKGAHIEARDQNGCTPLIYAARSGDPDTFKILLNAGADIKTMAHRGRDVFEWVSTLSLEISELFLSHTPVSKTRASKWLLKAASDGHIQNIQKCLARNAAIQPVDEENQRK
ncbi:MAG: ankyrin repeat domain-containing protein [Deltaproteobacteria bacterium]|nr:ankyrin repeat domain-containing protein [Deltaproteobacteria bacterium]